jgi:threonine synthase
VADSPTTVERSLSGVRAELVCSNCPWRGALSSASACPRCAASLSVAYPRNIAKWHTGDAGIWRYRPLLPLAPAAHPITLGEGASPLIDATRLGGRGTLLIKNESQNPTGSFKDRPVAVAATIARELGLEGLLCASTGNTAVAVGAYGARAGLPVRCFVPASTPAAKLAQTRASGARLVPVNGGYSDAYALAERAAARFGWANLTSTYVNPFMLEGDKTVGFEIWEQLGGQSPDWVVVPIGAGPLLGAVAKAWDELAQLGVHAGPGPRLLGVQASGCAPIARAFEAGETEVSEWPGSTATSASSIADPLRGYAADGTRTLRAIRASRGAAVAVSEAQIVDAATRLGRYEGLLAEPGAAAALAGYDVAVERGLVGPDERTVLVLTGHALKDPAALEGLAENAGTVAPPVDPGDDDAVSAALGTDPRG